MLGLRFICPPQGASAAEYRSGSLRYALRARPAAFAGSRLRPGFCAVSGGGFFHLRSIHAGCVSQRQRPQTANRPEGTALPLRRLLWAAGSFSLCHIHYRKLTLFFRQPLSAEDIAGNHGSREISPGTNICGRYRRRQRFAGDIAGNHGSREISPLEPLTVDMPYKKKNLSNDCETLKDSKKIPGIVLLVFAKGNEGNSGFARSEQGSILCM